MNATSIYQSLTERIGEKIDGHPDVDAVLSSYPSPAPDCWIWQGNAAMLIHHDGKSKRVVRTLFDLIGGEALSDAWIPVRAANCGSRLCINPTHFELKPHNQNRYGMEGPLPPRLRKLDTSELDEIRELIEEWENPDRSTFLANCAAFGFTFSEPALDLAFGGN